MLHTELPLFSAALYYGENYYYFNVTI